MSELSPSYESVFSEEYWGEIYDLPQPASVAPPLGVYKQMRELTASAAEAIFRGDERTRLPGGTKIDPEEEHPDLTPGTIALMDMESLNIGSVSTTGVDVVRDYSRPFYRQRYLTDEGLLMARPATLFMRNSRRRPFENEITVYPFTKSVPNMDQTAQYKRIIRLAAYGVGYDEEQLIKLIPLWSPNKGGGVRGMCSLKDAFSGVRFQPLEVGQSLINQEGNQVIRLRAAEICLKGSLEYAKARKKIRHGVFAGRLALAKQKA